MNASIGILAWSIVILAVTAGIRWISYRLEEERRLRERAARLPYLSNITPTEFRRPKCPK